MSRNKHFPLSPFLTSGPFPFLYPALPPTCARRRAHTRFLCCNFISITSIFCSVSQANTLGVKLKLLFITNPSNPSCLLVWLILSESKRELDEPPLGLDCILCMLSRFCRLCPWDSPGKNTGVDFHGLLQGIFQTRGILEDSGATVVKFVVQSSSSWPRAYQDIPSKVKGKWLHLTPLTAKAELQCLVDLCGF